MLVLSSALLAACRSGGVEWPRTDLEKPPYAEGVEVGKTYDYSLPTHCGILNAMIDGTMWEADPPQIDGANPPAGWDDPTAKGTLRLLSEDRAEFVHGDKRATFRRADAAPRLCHGGLE